LDRCCETSTTGIEITFSEPGAGKRFIDKLAERFKKDSR
jgi:hypothetical protein